MWNPEMLISYYPTAWAIRGKLLWLNSSSIGYREGQLEENYLEFLCDWLEKRSLFYQLYVQRSKPKENYCQYKWRVLDIVSAVIRRLKSFWTALIWKEELWYFISLWNCLLLANVHLVAIEGHFSSMNCILQVFTKNRSSDYVNKKVQLDATICRHLFTARSLYMFRVSQHPSSGALKTVTATSGIGHNVGTGTLMYINSQNTAVPSSISYSSFRYFIVVSFIRHVSAHSFGPSSGLTNILESTTVCNAYKAYIMI